MSDSSILGLALLSIEGLGKISASKLLRTFSSLDAIRSATDSTLQRILPKRNTARIITTLRDSVAMDDLLSNAKTAIEELQSKFRTSITFPGSLEWPRDLDKLSSADQPFPLYYFGTLQALDMPPVAFFTGNNVTGQIQDDVINIAGRLVAANLHLCTGLTNNLDLEIQSRCLEQPSVLVADRGFSKVRKEFRRAISNVGKSKGVLLSAYDLQNAPFSPNDRFKSQIMAALCSCSVFILPQTGTADWGAMEWCSQNGKSVFAWKAKGHDLPRCVHEIVKPIDLDWILVAAKIGCGMPLVS